MKLNNNQGLTLVELLIALTIAFTILGLVSSILIQSFRNMEIAETHTDLRQEANYLMAEFTRAHMSPITVTDESSYTYTITYDRIGSNWELTIGNQTISSSNYDIELELEQKEMNSKFTVNSTTTSARSSVEKKLPLDIKKLTLINKKDRTKTFQISTIISRL